MGSAAVGEDESACFSLHVIGVVLHADERVAMLCEKAGLVQRAMEHYTNVDDIKRAMSRTEMLNPEQLVKFFGTLAVENAIECMHHLLRTNMRQNLQLVVQVAREYSEQLTPEKLIEMFENYNSWEGLFYYLGAVLLKSEDKVVHFKYIQVGYASNASTASMPPVDMLLLLCVAGRRQQRSGTCRRSNESRARTPFSSRRRYVTSSKRRASLISDRSSTCAIVSTWSRISR